MIVYEFRMPLLTPTRSLPLVAKASRREVERFIPLDEFGPLFGGFILWNKPQPPTDEMPGDGLGVWGSRTVARFRRILRERGAVVERVKGAGPEQALKAIDQDYHDYRVDPTTQPGAAADHAG